MVKMQKHTCMKSVLCNLVIRLIYANKTLGVAELPLKTKACGTSR